MSETITIQEIQRLDVRPDEMLLVTIPAESSIDAGMRVHDMFKRALPGVKVLVKPHDITVSAVSQSD